MLPLAIVAAAAHVPSFGCVDGCCRVPDAHTISQAFYLSAGRGTITGLEIHLLSDEAPIDTTEANGIVDWGATFRDNDLDPSTVVLRVGCGGCARGDDLSLADVQPIDLQRGSIEPFGIAAMRAWGPGEPGDPAMTFPVARLNAAACPAHHFSVTLEVLPNSTKKTVVWAPVVGRGEWFTGEQLRAYPSYLQSVHGAGWTDAGWTLGLTLLIAVALVLFVKAMVYSLNGDFTEAARVNVLDTSGIVRWAYQPRELAYDVAVYAYTWACLENALHFFIAAAQPDTDVSAFAVFATFGLVIGFANVLPLVVTIACWNSMYVEDRRAWWVDADLWAPIELLSGVGWLHLFGSGFGIGPLATIAAAVYRLFTETSYLSRAAVRSRSGETVPATAKRLAAEADGV